MAKVISTISLKGGVGKTTVTAAVAEFMSLEFGQRVLLIDLDSQINLTTMMISEERWFALNNEKRTLAALFEDALDGASNFDLHSSIERGVSAVKRVTGVDLLPSSLDLIPLQERLSALRVSEGSATSGVDILGDAIAPVKDYYDYILIDCPPNVGPITLNGLAMSDAYIIPTIPDVLSTYGIPQIQTFIEQFAEGLGRKILELGLVITKYKSNSAIHRTTVRNLRRDRSIQNVLPVYLAESNSIAASAEFRDYGTLKVKYGNQGQFDQLREITKNIMTEAQAKL
ncbi:ParA family protein [Rhodococcus fascians]|jgi:chromosome partitioning protein|uniref:ParA family protein n=1 Tax=Nocardiaceae TaxID=85025 RepID=UPI00050C7916|nr:MULTISPECIES: ParA family protein [Rhodococcus]MBY4013526.1 ParA family protein [Rhodococcus fascians]MDP9638946.1 chromosome partitioning protein [Rhodococcus cercidiphylli]OZD41620.1 ParA family protein [Rhodococcus sp. 06-1477-1B]AMY54685.1 Sporulation initiation inhibitor protein Soj [Rhodococcus fascians D188]MBY4023844.1 ParA family protein [Rhodococcus fascians]